MASPSVRNANDGNPPSPVKSSTPKTNASNPRRPLGEVSANNQIRASSQTPAFLTKPLTGSPLKRSYTAAMEEGGGVGWRYLKKRKTGDLPPLSPGGQLGEGRESRLFINSDEEPILSPGIPVNPEPSPTEPNTPSDDSESLHHGSSHDRKSFSSLINYDPSSQTQPTTIHSSLLKTVSNAEVLKLRLRVAMYKVRTNQVSVPFLELPDPMREKHQSVNAAVEEAVATLRREAMEVQERDAEFRRKREEAVPALLPGPCLQPTAYSSRFIYDDGRQVLSSPPDEARRVKLPSMPIAVGEDAMTPRRSPNSGRKWLTRPDEAELTSSVVKEKVVQGLLGLRNAA